MSILDNESTLCDQLTSQVQSSELNYLITRLQQNGLLILSSEVASQGNSIYNHQYRTDYLLEFNSSSLCYDYLEYTAFHTLANINLNKYDNEYGIEPEYRDFIIGLRPIYYNKLFSTCKFYLDEEDNIIIEPIHKNAPILINNDTCNIIKLSSLNIKFKKPDGYNGYILAIDNNGDLYDIFDNFMIIYEQSIIQSIPKYL